MFKKILVPLDGSERSERAIPLAARIAHASGGSVVLLQVISPLREYGMYMMQPTLMIQQILYEDQAKASVYLAQQAATTALAGVDTRILVLSGPAESEILAVAQSEQIDLIVMCSHGFTGIKR
ncbi:MAG TPA: universal stress protein [Ktedonosporobacter sp.]|nr:universal stress protein [Ktedonosporobacter sp.]